MESLDEQSAPRLFQLAASRCPADDRAHQVIRQNPGIIPVAITRDHRVVWLDVGDYEFKEWKFRFAIQNLIEQRGIGACFSTGIEFLAKQTAWFENNADPAGFIFHMSKCGSTLMAKVLGQPENHLVMQEPSPLHENLWQYLTQNWQHPVEPNDYNLLLLRNLIQTLGRVRRPQQSAFFVRFRSWNTAFVEIIRQAFPDTPCLFMYRDPVEVMASILSKPTTGLPRLSQCGAAAFITGRSTAELQAMEALDYFTCFYKAYLEYGLYKMPRNTRFLNYRLLNKQNLQHILAQAFFIVPTKQDLSSMQAQFDIYSKDDRQKTRLNRVLTESHREYLGSGDRHGA